MKIVTREERNAPSREECRYAVLIIHGHKNLGYVIYDRQAARIVDGVYSDKDGALDVAQGLNRDNGAMEEIRPPNGDALGLLYPDKTTDY